ncbi:hypothetical protein ES332_D13G058100v1 [Gossypium tomentosum]|uniref:Uncharacterized protein n=1 Tax=Gossypium tomentosum TaxID=34277 RepID=A0A5D2HT40_GOSTO|nr:hypothetical protein ES332_D13G058100v1 [Gossypium tomentosum]
MECFVHHDSCSDRNRWVLNVACLRRHAGCSLIVNYTSPVENWRLPLILLPSGESFRCSEDVHKLHQLSRTYHFEMELNSFLICQVSTILNNLRVLQFISAFSSGKKAWDHG